MRLTLLLVFALSFFTASTQNIVKGRIDNYANSEVIIYQYDDLISLKRSIAAVGTTNAQGQFSISVPNSYQRLYLTAGAVTLQFFVLKDGAYQIANRGDKLWVAGEEGIAANALLHTIDSTLSKDWYPLFIDVKTGKFTHDADPVDILRKLDAYYTRFTTGTNDATLASWIYYRLGAAKCMYLQSAERKAGEQAAKDYMNRFEEEYFNSRPAQPGNPFYFDAMGSYLFGRSLLFTFQRAGRSLNYWEQLLAESGYLKDSARQLMVMKGMQGLYANKFHGADKTIMEKQIAQYGDTIKYEFIRTVFNNLQAKYHAINIGDAFPVIALKNEKGLPDSLTSSTAEVILIDFWATWCGPCREHMKDFPSLLKKYGRRLQIVSISVDDSLQTMRRYLDKEGYTGKWKTLHNGSSGYYHDAVRIDGYPTYYIIDKNKKIIAMPWFANMEAELKKIISTVR